MGKYKILSGIYLYAVLSSSFSNLFGLNVQLFHRVPFLNVRWIDVGILYVLMHYVNDVFFSKEATFKNNTIVPLCFTYLIFETVQLLRTWIPTADWQVSWFICTLCFFVLIDLLTYKLPLEKITEFLRSFAVWSALTLLLSNAYLFYSFLTGQAVFTDGNIRVALDVLGQKEAISTSVLTPFVYVFSLYLLQQEIKVWERALFIAAILSIYLSLVTEFHRGNLVAITLLTIIFIVVFSSKPKEVFKKVFTVMFIFAALYLVFGGILAKKGYDPIEKIVEITKYASDVDNPDWDKGRSISREYAEEGWKKSIYIGNGYNTLYNTTSIPPDVATAHNFIATSLFHRGIIGTAIYLLILILLFRNSIRFWFILKKENSYENDLFKLLIVASFFWLIPFWTQETMWEKYLMSLQFIYFGLISNAYRQKAYSYSFNNHPQLSPT